jgi:SAM-dependent methyltransferase
VAKVRIDPGLFLLLILTALFVVNPTAQSHTQGKSQKGEGANAGSSQSFARPMQNRPPVRFESMNANEPPGGDRLSLPRLIAAAVVAQDKPAPKLVVDVGSHQGEFLEAFLERFPNAHGQWTEPVEESLQIAKARLARFGNRIDYRIGCPGRDISDGCVPKSADVIITSWVSVHQDREGIARFYRLAAAQLPPGGWLINLDHIGFGGNPWESRVQARYEFQAYIEGPAPHGNHPVATLGEQLAAFKAAGIEDVDVVWRSFTTCLFMGRKR